MKKMMHYGLTLIACLLMSGLHAGVASGNCVHSANCQRSKDTARINQGQAAPQQEEAVADFIFTNRLLLF